MISKQCQGQKNRAYNIFINKIIGLYRKKVGENYQSRRGRDKCYLVWKHEHVPKGGKGDGKRTKKQFGGERCVLVRFPARPRRPRRTWRGPRIRWWRDNAPSGETFDRRQWASICQSCRTIGSMHPGLSSCILRQCQNSVGPSHNHRRSSQQKKQERQTCNFAGKKAWCFQPNDLKERSMNCCPCICPDLPDMGPAGLFFPAIDFCGWWRWDAFWLQDTSCPGTRRLSLCPMSCSPEKNVMATSREA